MNWRLIETAPKDRRILLYYPRAPFTGCNYQFGRWNSDQYAKNPKPFWDVDQSRIWGMQGMRFYLPTHWAEIEGPYETD